MGAGVEPAITNSDLNALIAAGDHFLEEAHKSANGGSFQTGVWWPWRRRKVAPRVGLIVAVLAGALFVTGSSKAATLPSLTPPSDITVQANEVCGQTDCATVSWLWTVTGGVAPYRFNCNFTSPSELPVGSHTITCTVTDSLGDGSPPASFTVTVTPGGPTPPPPPPPPTVPNLTPPADITVQAN